MKEHQQVYKRRIIRERVMQALYAFEISKDPLPHIVENIFAELHDHADEFAFAEHLLTVTVEHQPAIDLIIKKKATNWNFDRIALIDKLLLRMGICELYYFEDIPPKVTINETIEIAKHFSTEKSGQFINGILDSILHDMKSDGTLEKRGRVFWNPPHAINGRRGKKIRGAMNSMTDAPSLSGVKTSRLQIFIWTLFDFANTSFSVIVVAVGYSLYFKDIVAGGKGRGDFLWGIAVSISMLITAAIAPVLGAAADFSSRRKRFLFGFTLVSVLCTALLYFVNEGMILTGMVLFILANIGFEGGIVFYDAFLPTITTEQSYGRVSGYGFAMGYVGSLTTLLIAMPLYADGFIPSNLGNVKLSFVLAAVIFFVFAAPLFLFFRDHKVTFQQKPSYVKAGWHRVMETISHLKKYSQVSRFMLAFFIYNDGILTVISFASIFAQQSLHFTLQEIIILFAVVQGSGIVGSIIFGVITDKIGPKKTIDINLVLWLCVVTAAYFVQTKEMFFVIGIVAGSSLGAAQSASRSLMALLTPKEREAEFFGFYDGLCGKASAVIGTFLFGLISYLTNNQRLSILSVGAFFIIGLVLLQRVDDTRAVKAV